MRFTQFLYFSTFPLLPIMAVQGRYVRWKMPKLPEAGGPPTGQTDGEGTPMRLLVLGESTAAGCGVADHTVALSGQLAAALSRRTGQAVAWRVVGRNGVTARVTRQSLLPLIPIEPVDLVAIILGVNDTKDLTPARRWQRDLKQLFFDLRIRLGPTPLVVSGVPPMGSFPALPPPLRQFLGLRAALMDAALREAVAAAGQAIYAGPLTGLTPATFSIDRFHPGEAGYAQWADGLADAAMGLLTEGGSRTPADHSPR